jgi:hypothetical protein
MFVDMKKDPDAPKETALDLREAVRQAAEAVEVDPETGEISGLDQLREAEGKEADKVAALARVVRAVRREAAAVSEHIEAEKAILKRLETKADKLSDFLAQFMLSGKINRITDVDIEVKALAGRESVAVLDIEAVPSDFIKVNAIRCPPTLSYTDARRLARSMGAGAEIVRSVDKIAVMNEWKLGKNTIPGTVIFRTPGLKISA